MFFIPNVLSSGSEENQLALFVEISSDHLEDILLITTLLNRLFKIRYWILLTITVFVELGNKFEDLKRQYPFFSKRIYLSKIINILKWLKYSLLLFLQLNFNLTKRISNFIKTKRQSRSLRFVLVWSISSNLGSYRRSRDRWQIIHFYGRIY